MSHFEYTDPDGDTLTAEAWHRASGPTVLLVLGTQGEDDTASLAIPLDRLEEVIAGLRDMARQAGGQAGPLRRRLTELEHHAAWHAIEGAAGEEGADPDTVLNAVLRALGIDPPAATQPADCQCLPASPMAPRIYCDACLRAGRPTP